MPAEVGKAWVRWMGCGPCRAQCEALCSTNAALGSSHNTVRPCVYVIWEFPGGFIGVSGTLFLKIDVHVAFYHIRSRNVAYQSSIT